MADMGPTEPEKLKRGVGMEADTEGQQPEKAENKGKHEAGGDDKSQDGENGENNSEKEQEREVREDSQPEGRRVKRTWNSLER